jgi:hypothetical protein
MHLISLNTTLTGNGHFLIVKGTDCTINNFVD